LGDAQNIGGLSSFEEMLAALAEQAIVTQQSLDDKYVAMLRHFAESAPVTHFAEIFEPVRIALHTQSIDCRFSTGSESLRQIRLVNQVVSKRYRAQSITHSVHIEIRRTPIGPGQAIVK
jgi:hypothetical protein